LRGVQHPSIDLSVLNHTTFPLISDTIKLDNKQSLLARHSEKMENKFSIFLALGFAMLRIKLSPSPLFEHKQLCSHYATTSLMRVGYR